MAILRKAEQPGHSAYSQRGDQRKRSTSGQWWSGCVTRAGSGGHTDEKRLPTPLISPPIAREVVKHIEQHRDALVSA